MSSKRFFAVVAVALALCFGGSSSASTVYRAYQQAGSWTPIQVGINLELWLDGSMTSSVSLVGSKVAEWRDLSPYGRHARQDTDSLRPTVGEFLGKAVVRQALSTDKLTLDPFVISGPIYGVVVWTQRYNSPTAPWWFSNFTTVPNAVPYYVDGNIYDSFFSSARPSLGWMAQIKTPWIYGVWHDADTMFAIINGTGMTPVSNPLASEMKVARIFNQVSGGGLADIGEMIIVSQATQDIREKLEGYLCWKWMTDCITRLPFNHPYRLTPP